MKLIEIPEDMNDLRDYNSFLSTIIEVQKFNKNISIFFEKLLKDEFYKTVGEWRKTLSEKDNIKIDKLFGIKKPDKGTIDRMNRNLDRYRKVLESFQSKDDEGIIIDTNCLPHRNVKEQIKEYENRIQKLITSLNKYEDDPFYNWHVFYCYETNEFIRPENVRATRILSWDKYSLKPSSDGLHLIMTFKDSYKEYPTPGFLPTYHSTVEYTIDLVSKSVKKTYEGITKTSNN